MSSIHSDDSDGYVTCGSRASSIHHYVHWAPQHVNEDARPPSSPFERFTAADTTPDVPAADESHRSDFSHLISRLKLGGFRMDSRLPAVFKADNLGSTGHSVHAEHHKNKGMGDGGPDGKVVKHGHAYICGLRDDIFQNLMDHTRQLLARHLTSTVHPITSSSDWTNTTLGRAKEVYHVPQSDMEDVVKHLVRMMEALHHASLLRYRNQNWAAGTSSNKRTSLTNAITPRSTKKEAETATTIRVPHTYITPVVSLEDTPASTESALASTAATATSPVRGGHAGPSPSKLSVPSGASENRRRSSPAIKSASEAHHRRSSSHNSSESQIVSFPTLTKRHCTNDWLIPPAPTPGPKEPTKTDLYAHGIDAHGGPTAYFVPPSNIPLHLHPPAVEVIEFRFRTPSYAVEDKQPSVEVPRQLGSSIGTAAGRKLSTSHQVDSEPGSRRGSLFWRIGRNSAQLSSNGTPPAVSRHSSQTHLHREGRRSSSVEMMRAILDKAPPPPPTPASGRRGTVAHVQSDSGRKRPSLRQPDTCSEDGRPHACTEDDFRFSSYSLLTEPS